MINGQKSGDHFLLGTVNDFFCFHVVWVVVLLLLYCNFFSWPALSVIEMMMIVGIMMGTCFFGKSETIVESVADFSIEQFFLCMYFSRWTMFGREYVFSMWSKRDTSGDDINKRETRCDAVSCFTWLCLNMDFFGVQINTFWEGNCSGFVVEKPGFRVLQIWPISRPLRYWKSFEPGPWKRLWNRVETMRKFDFCIVPNHV